MLLVKLVFVSIFVQNIKAFKVLGILPFASKSHHAIGSSILKSLADIGHEVTVISAFPFKEKVKNYHDIKVTKILEVFERGEIIVEFLLKHYNHNTLPGDEVNPFIFGKYPAIGTIFILSKMNADVVDLFMEDNEVQKLLKSDQKFDVCVIENFLVDALLGIAEKYNCIVISYATFATVKWTDDITGKYDTSRLID